MARTFARLTLIGLLAQGAWGATFTVDVEDAKTYAKEVFGASASEVVVDYDDEQPKISLSIAMSGPESGGVEDGDAADITFALANAKFASNVRLSSLDITARSDLVDVTGRDDGTRDASTVTFRIEADQDLPTASTTVSFAFKLPELTGLNPGKPVTATVSVDSGGGSGWPDSAGATAGANTGLENGLLQALGPMPMTGNRPTKPLISFADGLRFVVGGSGNTRMIDLAGGRTGFTTDGAAALGTVTLGLETAAACDSDSPSSDCVLQSGGDPFGIARREDGEGDLIVTARGDFRDGDMVWLDADASRTAQASETLTMNDDGTASGTFDIASLAGDSTAARDSLARDQGIATKTLYYTPNGEDGLRPSEYRTRFSVDFDAAGNRDKPEQESSFNTEYAMTADPTGAGAAVAVEATRTAGSVPALTAVDVGNLRIKCEVSSPCVIHLECDDVSGESWFARLDEPIPGRATLHLTASDIAEALGISAEEGWDDSLSCAILGSRDISVQVLTRSGGVLVNHTYVEND